MADRLERHEGKTSFAYSDTGGVPWHRTGTSMDGLQSVDSMLTAAYADYDVEVVPVYVQAPDGETYVPVEAKKATARISPHTGEYEALAVVGNRYVPVQNREVLERAVAVVGASDGDAIIDTLGVLDGGRRFFSSIDLGSLVIDPRGAADKIARYLLVYNSHDGTTPITYANTDIRAVCANTVKMGLDSAQSTFKVKHYQGFSARMEEAQEVLRLSTEWAKEFKEMAERMMSIPMTPGRLDRVIDAAFPADKAVTDRQIANRSQIVSSIYGIYGSPKNALAVGTNGWAAWNSVVEYLDHHRDASPEERALTSMDDTSWVTKRKFAAQQAVLSLA
jgi:phage/plasmid-like protein (TIGR03299 family)